MPATRHVIQNKLSGHWEVRRPRDKRSAHTFSTQQGARRRAVRLVTEEGGGHVHILNDAQKVVHTIRVR